MCWYDKQSQTVKGAFDELKYEKKKGPTDTDRVRFLPIRGSGARLGTRQHQSYEHGETGADCSGEEYSAAGPTADCSHAATEAVSAAARTGNDAESVVTTARARSGHPATPVHSTRAAGAPPDW